MSLPTLTTREMCRIECGHPGIFPVLTWCQRVFQMWSKLCRILRAQIESVRCDTVLPKSAEIHDTCIRPRECVCGSTCNHGSTRAHVTSSACSTVSSSSQRVGALSPIPSCLGIGGHPSGSRQGHLRYIWGPISGKAVGGPSRSDSTVNSAETPQTW